MNGIDILFLMIISVTMFFIGQFVLKKTKVAPAIVYLLFGITFGVGGLALLNDSMYILGNSEYFPNEASYSSYALYLMFMGAGFSISLKKR